MGVVRTKRELARLLGRAARRLRMGGTIGPDCRRIISGLRYGMAGVDGHNPSNADIMSARDGAMASLLCLRAERRRRGTTKFQLAKLLGRAARLLRKGKAIDPDAEAGLLGGIESGVGDVPGPDPRDRQPASARAVMDLGIVRNVAVPSLADVFCGAVPMPRRWPRRGNMARWFRRTPAYRQITSLGRRLDGDLTVAPAGDPVLLAAGWAVVASRLGTGGKVYLNEDGTAWGERAPEAHDETGDPLP